MNATHIDQSKLRAWWAHRQGLDGALARHNADSVLARTGWARSVGGAAPYLTLFARAGIRREAADSAVAKLEIHELPSARGCTYVVPGADYEVALTVGQPFVQNDRKVAAKLGVTDIELKKLRAAVLRALAKGPLTPDEIRDATGNAARNLGEEGKRKGMITTLPVALGELQAAGEIRRIPINGRLDQQRYKYAVWEPSPLANQKVDLDAAYVELARRYFSWIGPATLAEFQWFSGLSAKAAKAAIAPLKLEPVVEGSDLLLAPEHRESFEKFRVPEDPHYLLVSSLDGISALRRNNRGLIDPADMPRLTSGLTDLPNHAILDRGRIVGLWDFDPEIGVIAWTSFVKASPALRRAVAEMEEFVRTELGDARAFSLDSPKSRVSRLEALRAAATA